MPLLTLRERRLQPEIMDDPGLEVEAHHRALRAIRRINAISASAQVLYPSIRELCREREKAGDSRPVRILDVATGGGDVASRLWRLATKRGRRVEIAGCDFSPVALEHAKQTAARMGATISFFRLNLLEEPIPTGYDAITCSLFLHHLDAEKAVLVLQKMRAAAGSMALVNDLARSRLGWWAAYIGTRVLTRSPVVHADGVMSVEGAFTKDEALALAVRAGWEGATVRSKFPFRYLLKWRRS